MFSAGVVDVGGGVVGDVHALMEFAVTSTRWGGVAMESARTAV